MYKWLIDPALTASTKLENGFINRELREIIQQRHPRGETLNPRNLTQALQSVASLQVEKNITPIILDYDQTNLRLNIVDLGFIIWLNHQNRSDLLTAAGLPTDTGEANPTLSRAHTSTVSCFPLATVATRAKIPPHGFERVVWPTLPDTRCSRARYCWSSAWRMKVLITAWRLIFNSFAAGPALLTCRARDPGSRPESGPSSGRRW